MHWPPTLLNSSFFSVANSAPSPHKATAVTARTSLGETMEMRRSHGAEPIDAAPGSNRITRRTLLKSAVTIASAAVSPFEFAGTVLAGQSTTATKSTPRASRDPAKNPRWYGFNLLEYFSTDPDWM